MQESHARNNPSDLHQCPPEERAIAGTHHQYLNIHFHQRNAQHIRQRDPDAQTACGDRQSLTRHLARGTALLWAGLGYVLLLTSTSNVCRGPLGPEQGWVQVEAGWEV